MNTIHWTLEAGYDFDIVWECDIRVEWWPDKFLLTKKEEGRRVVLEMTALEEKEEIIKEVPVNLEWEELEDYFIGYCEKYKKETWKDFLRRIRAKINFAKKKEENKEEK